MRPRFRSPRRLDRVPQLTLLVSPFSFCPSSHTFSPSPARRLLLVVPSLGFSSLPPPQLALALALAASTTRLCSLAHSLSDVGKILCGIQVPPSEGAAFTEWLDSLKYPYVEETANPAYADFLAEDDSSESEAEGR